MLNPIRHLAAMATLGSFALLAPFAQATTQGLPTNGNSFATWDTFAATNFSNAAPDSANPSIFSATLTSAMIPGGGFPKSAVTGGGDRIYSGVELYNLTLDGTSIGSIDVLAVQIKFVTGAGPASSNFSLSLAGFGTADSQTLLGTTSETETYNVYQWTWNGLGLTPSDSFSINATGNFQHTVIDAIRVSDVAAVPEPGTIALLTLAGAGGLLLLRRRNRV